MFSRWCWSPLAILLAWSAAANAIVIRHDRPDQGYLALEQDYPQVFFLQTRYRHKVCVATLVDRHWALTAAHCTDDTPVASTLATGESYPVSVAGRSNAITALVVHPDYQGGEQLQGTDLALLYLEQPVEHIRPAILHDTNDEVDRVLDLVGWGYSGEGVNGRSGNDGRFRRAQNRVDAASDWLEFRFDDPRVPGSGALELEGIPGLGDSGGPALWRGDGAWHVMGIAVGEMESADPAQRQGLYGAVEIYERVSRHLPWIHGVMARPQAYSEAVSSSAASP